MKVSARTFWMAAALAAVMAAGLSPARSTDAGSSGGSASRPAGAKENLRIEPMDPAAVPITPPSKIKVPGSRKRPLLPNGVMIIDRVASIEDDPTGKWRTIKDPRVGLLYLLPCELLQTVEKAHAEEPAAQFKLSGEVHRHHGGYYMLLHQALLMPPATTHPTSAPATTQPASRTTATAPASRPAGPKEASADDVAAELLRESPGRPIVPVVKPPTPKPETAPSGVPAGRPLKPGPGKAAVHRLARLLPREAGRQWYKLAFQADNTLREPPMRILPNMYLERMESLSRNGTAFGVIFHISGEVHRYRGKDYLLLRAILTKRDLNQF